MELAMGLPSIIVHPTYRYAFLFSYILILVVLLPYIFTRYFKAGGHAVAVEDLESRLKGCVKVEERDGLRRELLLVAKEARLMKVGRGGGDEAQTGGTGPRGITLFSVQWIENHLDLMLDKEKVIPHILSGCQETFPGWGSPEGTERGRAWGAEEAAELKDLVGILDPPAGGRLGNQPSGYSKFLNFHKSIPPITPPLIDANFLLLHARLNRIPLTREELRVHSEELALLWPDLCAVAAGHALLRMHRIRSLLANTPPDKRPPGLKKHWVGAAGMATVESLIAGAACMVQALPQRDIFENTPTPFRQVFTPAQFAAFQKASSASSGPAYGAQKSLLHLLRLTPSQRMPLLLAAAAAAAAQGTGEEQREAQRLERVLASLPLLEVGVYTLVKGSLPFGWEEAPDGLEERYIKPPAGSGSPERLEASGNSDMLAVQWRQDVSNKYSVVGTGDFITLRICVRHSNCYGSRSDSTTISAPNSSVEDSIQFALGNSAAVGPALPVPFTPSFPSQLAEEWNVWVEDESNRQFFFPLNAREIPFQTWSPSQAWEYFDLSIGELGLGTHRLNVQFRSSVYLGIDPEPFKLT